MEFYHVLLTVLIIVWSGGGPLFYLANLKRVKKLPQKIILLILAGPVTWAILPIVALSDWFIEKFFKWLYKD